MGDANTENVKATNVRALLAAVRAGRLDFTYDEIGLRLIDPRGIGAASEGAAVVDDYLYDTKFWHNSLADYDVMNRNLFELDVSRERGAPRVDIRPTQDQPFARPYRGLHRYFPQIMAEGSVAAGEPAFPDPHWLLRFVFLMGTHFCAMVPFHVEQEIDGSVIDDWRRQQRPIAVYCQGLRWLNEAVAAAEGRHAPLVDQLAGNSG
jgi:hypothetical protein